MPYKRRNVLVVDDNPTARTVAAHLISRDRRFRVTAVAADGVEALRMAEDDCPDLVVLDNEMPRLSGLEVLPVLQRRCPDAKIVIWSMDTTVRERTLAAGGAFVDKAEPVERLVEWLRRAT